MKHGPGLFDKQQNVMKRGDIREYDNILRMLQWVQQLSILLNVKPIDPLSPKPICL